MIKSFLKSVIQRLGLIVIRQSSRAYVPEDDVFPIVAGLCDRPDPVIIDGGSHKGDTVFQLSGFFDNAGFHCFEPDPDLAAQLVVTFKDNTNVSIVAAALGQTPGKAEFNVNASKPTNSLLPVSDVLQPDLKRLCELDHKVEVEVTTIDAYCRLNDLDRVDILKLDLQGYDLQALQGAGDTLKNVKIVLVEVLFTQIYKGCGLFPDILALMAVSGFDLYTLSGLQYGHDSELLWANAVFVKNRQ